MPYYFGRGITAESPGNAFTAAYDAAQLKQKQSKLADLLANAYGTQDDAQRQQYVQEAIRTDPQAGMGLAKLLDPRLSGSGGKPAQQQYAEWLLSQAPADQRDQVLGVLAGYKARPSGAAITYKDGEDEYGNPIVRAFDPNNVGGQVIGTGQTYGAPVGTGQRMGGPQRPSIAPPPAMAGRAMFAGLGQIPGVQVTSGLRTPEHNRKVGGVANSYHLTGQARDIVPPRSQEQAQMIRQYADQNGLEIIDEGDHWHLEPRGHGAATPPPAGGFVGRRKEDEAAAVEAAKQRVQLQYAPQVAQADASRAGMVAAATEQAKTGAAASAALPQVEQSARLMLDSIKSLRDDQALRGIVGLNGKFNPNVYIPGTPEQRALSKAQQLQGQAFLQAYNQLRGAGQITEVEGQKAEDAMGRLSRAQSYEDYIGALDELTSVIQNAVQSARAKASGASSGQPRVRRWNPSTGRLE